MRSSLAFRSLIVAAAAYFVSGCVTARLHTEAELNDVGRTCGLALGELFQDESEKRLLFLFKVQPTAAERACVHKFARRNGLRTVFIDAINEPVG